MKHEERHFHEHQMVHECVHHVLTVASLALIYLTAKEVRGLFKIKRNIRKHLEEQPKKHHLL